MALNEDMTVSQLKREITGALTEAVGAGEAAAMSREIIRHLLGYSPVKAVINGDRTVEPLTVRAAGDIVARVKGGEPLQYIVGTAPFMGMELKVTPAVLIPRPETAELVDIIGDAWKGRTGLRVLDIGTGSGCIAIALSRLLPFSTVTGLDVSADALDVARENDSRLGAKVTWRQADILTAAPQAETYDIIVSNPPYIADSERQTMDPRVYGHEPTGALFVPDSDPLKFYRAIAAYASTALCHGGALYFEINPLLVDGLRDLLTKAGFAAIAILRDFRGNYRFAVCHR